MIRATQYQAQMSNPNSKVRHNCQQLYDFPNKIRKIGSPSWIRTNDQVINSHLLYR